MVWYAACEALSDSPSTPCTKRSVHLTRGSLEQTEEGRAWPSGARFEFRMELDTDIVWMVVEFKDFTALTGFVFADKHQTGLLDTFDEVGVDLIPVAMALVHRITGSVQGANG